MPDSASRTLRLQGIERVTCTVIIKFEDRDVDHYCSECSNRRVLYRTRGRICSRVYGFLAAEPFYVIGQIEIGIPCEKCGTIYRVVGINQ